MFKFLLLLAAVIMTAAAVLADQQQQKNHAAPPRLLSDIIVHHKNSAAAGTCMRIEDNKCPGADACKKAVKPCNSTADGDDHHRGCVWTRDGECPGAADCKKAFFSCVRPLYKQCDPTWARDVMGSNGQTICDVGCLMSSFSMALAARNITVRGRPANPGTVNAFNRAHGCYVAGTSDMYDTCPDKISPDRIKFVGIFKGHTSLSLEKINDYLLHDKKVIIPNVLNGQHFVLAEFVDLKKQLIYVNDPGFNRDSYPYDAAMVGYNVWEMN